MPATRTHDTVVVAAAQAGNPRALDDLVTIHLPLVYTIVRRALDDSPDVDDVVQDIMVRALRQLSSLRSPENFRPWLTSIALRQISTHLRRTRRAAGRAADLDEAADLADPAAPSEESAVLRVELSVQRRQVRRASRWLDPDDRALLPLWWLESTEHLSRPEVAAALGLSVAHAGVRIQRMRGQLEVSRAVVAALEARPGCERLGRVVADWDGRPGPLWRKRVARHVRSCAVCARATGGLITTDRLLPVLALLPVPAGLTAASVKSLLHGGVAGATGSAGAGVAGHLMHAAAAHPIVSAVAAGSLVLGAGAAAVRLTAPEPPAPAVIAAPPRAAAPTPAFSTPAAAPSSPAPASSAAGPGALTLGPVSLEAQNAAGRFIATTGDLGVLDEAGAGSPAAVRARATFRAVPGLADAGCFSFRVADGRYLRHASWRVRLSRDEGTNLFRGDATFCARPGAAPGSLSLESSNYPGWFVRHRNGQVWVDQSDGSATFRADSAFLVRPPLSR
jgi:RNA polymerase sigma factor (sigma-70 family)